MKTIRFIIGLSLVVLATTALLAKQTVQIFPSGATVPENLLRIELRFSTPLQPPLSVQQVKLMDSRGVEIKDAFLDLLLPSSDGDRVTILLHPGRVKTGVGANLALGRALHTGETVTLVVNHPTLKSVCRKTWQVVAFDAAPPQPSRWTLEQPEAGSRHSLVLHLDEPISSSAEYLIAICGPDGEQLAGVARLENGETLWRFTPSQPWRAGSYALVTHPDLEDLAGNRPCEAFEFGRMNQAHRDEGTARSFVIATRQTGRG